MIAADGTVQDATPRPTRRLRPRHALLAIRVAALAALVAAAVLTPGFLTPISLFSLMTTVSFVGCVAIGMTFITLSGNVMSFALGATVGATSIVFVGALPLGLAAALAVAFVFAGVLTGLQGWLVGVLRANPIIVSMAVLALIIGSVTFFTGGRGIYPEGGAADVLKGRIGPLPLPVVVFLATAVVAQLVLSFTVFGRKLYLVGSNPRAARAAGIEPWGVVAGAYALAGLCTALSAVMMAARYGSGDMELGLGYDYQAISAVLVGGTAIEGGQGSAWRTVLGVVVVATVQALLLLHGFSTQTQYLAIGVIVLVVIMLHTLGEGA
jgi:ribose/xylose/arabinose/galactoside ABC-type transport system permease subunit